MSPVSRFSAARTDFLTGSKYVPRVLSGNSDVLHCVDRTAASTLIEPKPAARTPNLARMSSAKSGGKLTKYQAPGPSNCYSSALKTYMSATTVQSAALTPTSPSGS
jgi:hypothetical protein